MNQKTVGTAIAVFALCGSATAASPPSKQNAESTAPTAQRFDFNGFWSGAQGGINLAAPAANPDLKKDVTFVPPLRNGDIANLTNDNVLALRNSDNLPLYKPEHWDKVVDLDWNGNQLDPFNHCMPVVPPRLGPPRKIVMLPNEVIMFHTVIFQPNEFRIIPFGQRNHPIDRDGTWRGDPVARWEGDTLVIETEGFNAETWFGPEGYFHGYEMKVTERYRPDGNNLIYQVTVEDPEVLAKPWTTEPIVMRRITAPTTYLAESPPCSERDNEQMTGKQREM
jgi:hypothetical protein